MTLIINKLTSQPDAHKNTRIRNTITFSSEFEISSGKLTMVDSPGLLMLTKFVFGAVDVSVGSVGDSMKLDVF